VEDCEKAVAGVDAVSHQAALGSVPRSINDPITSHNVNVNGFLNILEAVRKFGVKKMAYASSSSVYGDLADSPKVEERTGKLLSPYAATKMANELYAEVYAKTYGIQLIGFRYFNVFGPRQDPDGPYAAVIPLFIKAALNNDKPTINGDGSITRDFTFIKNVINANISALTNIGLEQKAYVFNVACGKSINLNKIWEYITVKLNINQTPIYGPQRKGDILHSLADVTNLRKHLNYTEVVNVEEGLNITVDWYLQQKK
jgi:UDP-N-acetylglucosamine 4-epimerase